MSLTGPQTARLDTASAQEDVAPPTDGLEPLSEPRSPHWLALSPDGEVEDRFALHVMSFQAVPEAPRPGIDAAGTLRAIGRMPLGAISNRAVITLSRAQLVALSREIDRALNVGAPPPCAASELQLAGLVTRPDHEAVRPAGPPDASDGSVSPPVAAPTVAEGSGAVTGRSNTAGPDPKSAAKMRSDGTRAERTHAERKGAVDPGGHGTTSYRTGPDEMSPDEMGRARVVAATAALLDRRTDGWRPAIASLCLLALVGASGAALTHGTAHNPISVSWAAPLPGVFVPTPVTLALAPRLAPSPPLAPSSRLESVSRAAPMPGVSMPTTFVLALAPSPRLARAVDAAIAEKPSMLPALAATPSPAAPPSLVLPTTQTVDNALEATAKPAAMAAPDAAGAADTAVAAPHIAIRATTLAWIKLSDMHGRVVARKLLEPGELMPVPPLRGLRLTTGNAGGTEVLVDGTARPPLGHDGAVSRDLDLDSVAN